MRFSAGDFAHAAHPVSKRTVSVLVIGVRGRVLEYFVTDGEAEWSTFMLREIGVGVDSDATHRRRRGERWNR
jgi:hypothetical protein